MEISHNQNKVKAVFYVIDVPGVKPIVGLPDWVNSLVIVEKKDGSLRLCLDPKDLNKAFKREYYNAPTIEAISSNLNGMEV